MLYSLPSVSMEFRNLTPFAALCFGALDAVREVRVVVMRVSYRLEPRARTSVPGWFDATVIDQDPPPLTLTDRYSGEEGRSSVVCESDLAPYKPRCDVLVQGSAHAPGGRPATRWTAGLRVSRLEPRDGEPSSFPDGKGVRFLIDKKIVVHGSRHFVRTWSGGWDLPKAQAARAVPLSYERAFGGASLVTAPGADGAPRLDEVCYQNPVGAGWRDAQEVKRLGQLGLPVPDVLPAPQLEYPDDPIDGMYLARQRRGPLSPAQMLEVVRSEPHRTAGFGPVGRAWTPRLQRAGTYDDAWLRERWPGLPLDFDFGYWNGAPEDQQIDHPPPSLVLELWNLTDPRLTPGGYLVTQLPAHRAFVLMRLRSGAMVPLPMLTDTVSIDTDAMEVSLVHRVSVPVSVPVRVLEARFEMDPSAPLVSMAPRATGGDRGSVDHGQ